MVGGGKVDEAQVGILHSSLDAVNVLDNRVHVGCVANMDAYSYLGKKEVEAAYEIVDVRTGANEAYFNASSFGAEASHWP